MSDFEPYRLIWVVGALALAFAAFRGERLSLGIVVRGILGWAAIGLVAFFVIQHRHELGGMFSAVSARLGLDDQQVEGKTVRIRMAIDGHFWARVRINGVERHMLIDSGATITAISTETAEAAGIRPQPGMPVILETANGSVEAQRARAKEISIGPLSTQDLGVVIAPNFGEVDLLGMNFLSRLKSWRVEGKTLVLDPGGEESGEAVELPADTEAEGRRPKAAR